MKTQQELVIEALITRLQTQMPTLEQLSDINAILDNKRPRPSVPRLPLSTQVSFNSSATGSTESGSNTPKSPRSRESSPRDIKLHKIRRKSIISSDPVSITTEDPIVKKLKKNIIPKLDKKSVHHILLPQTSENLNGHEFFYFPRNNEFSIERIFEINRKEEPFGKVQYQSCVYRIRSYNNPKIPRIISGKAYEKNGINTKQRNSDRMLRENEIKILRLLDRYYGHFELPNQYFIFQTCKEGVDWSKLPTKPRPFALMKIFIGIMVGLRFIHEKGILHRDLKPANIIIGANNEPFIIDFGAAVMANVDEVTLKQLIGTFGFHWKGLMATHPKERECFSFIADLWTLSIVFASQGLTSANYLEVIKSIKISTCVHPHQIQQAMSDVLEPDWERDVKLENEILGLFLNKGREITEDILYKHCLFPNLKQMVRAFFFENKGVEYAINACKNLQILLEEAMEFVELEKDKVQVKEKEQRILTRMNSVHNFFNSKNVQHMEKNTVFVSKEDIVRQSVA